MNTTSTEQPVTRGGSKAASAEQRLKELGIELPAPPEPFGAYVEAVQTGNLLFLSGMLPTERHGAKFTGRVGAELDVAARQRGRSAPRGEPPRAPDIPKAEVHVLDAGHFALDTAADQIAQLVRDFMKQ